MIRYVTQLRAMPLSVTTQRSAYPFLNAANAAKIATASASGAEHEAQNAQRVHRPLSAQRVDIRGIEFLVIGIVAVAPRTDDQ